jgi:hypothetical protein
MPHLITHRPRVTNLGSRDEQAPSHKLWETINAFSYKVGGLAFVAGSVFFFPTLAGYLAVGDWLFFCGSLLYLLVTGHDLLEVIKYWRWHDTNTFADRIEFVAASSYVSGSALFTIGSIFFLPTLNTIVLGCWCFIIGSALFVIGGFVNTLQVVEAPSLLYMQLFNTTIAQFIVGSALFLVATIPYLWHLAAPAQRQITTLAAALFLFASVLFFTGGIAIYYRKLVRDKLEAFCHASGFGTMFIHALRSEIEDKATLERRRNPA